MYLATLFATVVCATLNVYVQIWLNSPLTFPVLFAELVFGAINRVLQHLMCCTELQQTPSCICQVVLSLNSLWRSLFTIC